MAQTFRIHAVGLPHTQPNLAFTACAFTERVRKFCTMMTGLGHEVFLYAGPGKTDAVVTEHIPCITEEDRLAVVAGKHFVEASFNYSLPHWLKYNQACIDAIAKRIQPLDVICIIGGLAHKQILDAFPGHLGVEFSIGYGGNFAKFRVWESSEWMHTCYGAQGGNPNATDGRFYDEVIPGSFAPEDFPFRSEKEDFLLFVGRLIERKGIGIAVEVARRTGRKLVIAGQGDPPKEDFIEYRGVVGPEERGDLMSRAHALLSPTIYIGPFENVAVEAQLCGTPAIVTPWGAFRSTVEHDVTGFHCHILRDFIEAVERAPNLDPHYMRRRAIHLYSPDTVAQKYQRYFERLMTLHGDGWYQL